MRLIILADAAAPHTRRWALWFALRGHEVHVVSVNEKSLQGYEPATVHAIWNKIAGNSLPERILKIPIILARLRRLIRRFPPDIIHAHSAGGYAWMAMLCGFRPYVVTPWGTDLLVDIHQSWINRLLTQRALRCAELVTTDGLHFVDILRSLGVSADKVFVHMFGTNINQYSPGSEDGERRALDIGDGPVVISTRTLYPVHDVETFVRALPAIHQAYPNACFVIVGDGSERNRLEAMAASLGVKDVTRFTGMVEEDRLRRLLRVSTVYVSTSLRDAGLAGSTAEAMATALPVIQTNNSDNALWTPDGQGGLLVKDGDPGAIAAAVCRLLGDREECRRMGARNRQVIVERNNMDTELARIEAHYERLKTESARIR